MDRFELTMGFGPDDLKAMSNVLSKLADTFPATSPNSLILVAARNIATERTVELLETFNKEHSSG